MKKYTGAILVIGFGFAWLLARLGVLPGWQVVWTLGLAAAGVSILTPNGFNRDSFVSGMFLIICAVFSIIRQLGYLRFEIELPLLVIVYGLLLAINRSGLIPPAEREST